MSSSDSVEIMMPERDPRFANFLVFARRFVRRPIGVISLTVVLLIAFAAVFTDVAATHDPLETLVTTGAEAFAPPSISNFFGTDQLGRDNYSRIVDASRTALMVGVVSILIGAGIGVPIGVTAGYSGGIRDEVLMRLMDALFAFPGILLALMIIAALGTGIQNVMLAIGITFIPSFARLVRGTTLSVKEQEFVLAARSIGAGGPRVAARHILPNTFAPVVVQASLLFGVAIIIEASLSFLGLGTRPPDPSWGTMLNSAQRLISSEPMLAIFPGLAIVVTVLAFNLLGDVLRDLLDPRLRGTG
ncbi:MAG: ABC transporter permease [Chloroflexi bacterium]|nr:ABC transporter permease [Chloroflexota bacterium]